VKQELRVKLRARVGPDTVPVRRRCASGRCTTRGTEPWCTPGSCRFAAATAASRTSRRQWTGSTTPGVPHLLARSRTRFLLRRCLQVSQQALHQVCHVVHTIFILHAHWVHYTRCIIRPTN